MTTTTLFTTVRDELRERREAKARIRTMRAELATYSTPEQIDDLLAAVGRVDEDDPEAADARLVESILQDNLVAWHAAQAPRARVAGL